MIKLIASLLMLIDHTGAILFPTSYIFRIIGRFSMPLFAYCIARGFYYSKRKNTFKRYFSRMFLIAILSQIPFSIMQGGLEKGLNTCFTWLMSLFVLQILTNHNTKKYRTAVMIVFLFIQTICLLLPYVCVDYGFFGIFMPVVFYYGLFLKKGDIYRIYLMLIVLWGIQTFMTQGNFLMQIISLGAVPIILYLIPRDNKVMLPKWISYVFYPVHIILLLMIRLL